MQTSFGCRSICLRKVLACGASKTPRRQRCGVNAAASTLWCQRVAVGTDPYGFVRITCQSLKFSLSHFVLARSLRSACSFGFLKSARPGGVGVRGKTRLFAKRKCRALLVYKQSYGCFEMVSPPRKQVIQKFISIAKNLNFTCSPFPTATSII